MNIKRDLQIDIKPYQDNKSDEDDQLTLSPSQIDCYDKARIIKNSKCSDKFIEENTCPVCLNLIRDICQCQLGCQGVFGYNCIAHNAITGCPYCRRSFENNKLLYRNGVIAKMNQKALQIKCQFFEQGCQKIMDYHHEIIDAHENLCEYKRVQCQFARFGCVFEDQRYSIGNHEKDCSFQQFECVHCKKIGDLDFRFSQKSVDQHLKDCKNKKIIGLVSSIRQELEQSKRVKKDAQSEKLYKLLEESEKTINDLQNKISFLNQKSEQMIKYATTLEKNQDKKRDKAFLLNDFNNGIVNFYSLETLQKTLDLLDRKYIKGVRWNENNLFCYQFSFKSKIDFVPTINFIEDLAKKGEKFSQYSLARLYIFGDKDIQRDVEKSLHWVNKSIEQNCAEGKYLLGRIQHNSIDKKAQDFDKLLKLVNSACQLGNPEAKNFLGFVYGKGEGMNQNQKKALTFYLKAAQQGNFAALLNLGSYYEGGYGGLEINPEKSYKYFEKSAKKGYVNAMIKIVQLLRSGKGADQDEFKALKWDEKIQHHTMHYTHTIQWQQQNGQQQDSQ